eukprot:m.154581 g.154581  ORF g.154581 m.154581 type:complete len:168 (+) comp30896_c0_seq1:106-609(+)
MDFFCLLCVYHLLLRGGVCVRVCVCMRLCVCVLLYCAVLVLVVYMYAFVCVCVVMRACMCGSFVSHGGDLAVKKIDPTGHTTHPTSSSEKPTTVDITKHDADDVADVDAVANVNPDADTEVNTHEGDGNAFQRRLDDVASGFTKTETNLEACKILMQQVSLRLNAFS